VLRTKVRAPAWRAWLALAQLFAISILAADNTGVRAAQTDFTGRPGGFQFDRRISRQVLENYLSRSICVEGLLTGRSGPLPEEIRMLTNCGAKYVARALCLWGAENYFLANVQKAKEAIPQVQSADPEIVLEACVFETVGPKVSQLAIPDWVFRDLGQPVEQRNFRYEDIIYPEGQRRAIGPGQVPDESRLETQLWFYYQAASYIDAGCEAIHFGQVEIMNKNDPGNTNWFHLLSLVRKYAAKHANRHMVICNGHVPTGGLMYQGNPLLDFHAFPLRIKEIPDKPQEAILQAGFTDAIYNRSKGGKTFSGWSCDHLPYFVEFDNYGQSDHPGKPNPEQTNGKRGFLWIWGYDEITWFSLQPKEYRAKWLQYAWDWVRNTDTNGYLEMPGGRTARRGKSHWYYANNPSEASPDGLGDEAAIRAVWANDAATQLNKRHPRF
jgi:hypothetical protein